jgi:hypothetical protein
MKSIALIAIFAGALVALAADDRPSGSIPPVLRPLEPPDSSVFRLPNAPATTAARKFTPPESTKPVPEPSPIAAELVLKPLPPLPFVPTPRPMPAPPSIAAFPVITGIPSLPVSFVAAEPAKPALPAEAAQEMAFFCQKRIGQWTESDARKLLGTPVRSRLAFDEAKKTNGKILAFRDPTARYRELELDFDSRTGTLRTVFVYPHKMTFQDVRRRWQGEVSSAEAPQGRTFYSYANRRIDVLVDATGKVISLGLY